MKINLIPSVLIALVSVFFVGCASTTTKPLTINTRPAGAHVQISGNRGQFITGKTPATFQLSPKDTYKIMVKKPGFETVEFTGGAYSDGKITVEKMAAGASAFICPPVGLVWIGGRWVTGGWKNFQPIEFDLTPLEYQQAPTKEAARNQPPVKKRDAVERKTSPRSKFEIEIEVFERELEDEFGDGSEGTRPKVKRRYVPAPQNDED